MSEPVTAPETPETPDAPAKARSGFWREASGALALGMVALAVVVVVFALLALVRGVPGPGLFSVFAHLGAAALAILAQRFVDRRTGRQQVFAVLTVAVVAGATLWLFWWA